MKTHKMNKRQLISFLTDKINNETTSCTTVFLYFVNISIKITYEPNKRVQFNCMCFNGYTVIVEKNINKLNIDDNSFKTHINYFFDNYFKLFFDDEKEVVFNSLT